jgi:hypothetical protein
MGIGIKLIKAINRWWSEFTSKVDNPCLDMHAVGISPYNSPTVSIAALSTTSPIGHDALLRAQTEWGDWELPDDSIYQI